MNRFQQKIELRDGEALFQVGGSVRDRLLGRTPADVDGVLLTPDPEGAGGRLTQAGLAPVVGRNGGRAWRGRGIDLTVWPREPGQPVEEALRHEALQRDFTLNALYSRWGIEEVIDPLGGQADLRRGIVRATGAGALVRDPVRVLRLARLASGLDFQVDPATLAWARAVDPGLAAGERVGREVLAWLTQSAAPGKGLDLWADSGAIRAIPEVAALQGVAQRADHHPEGDVWIHTGQVLDRAAQLGQGLERGALGVLMLSALFHDVGKAITTRWELGRWRAHGHEAVSRDLTQSRLKGWGLGNRVVGWTVRLVADHGRPMALARDGASLTGWWRLLDGHPCPELLFLLAQADSQGRVAAGEGEPSPPLFTAGMPFRAALDRWGQIPMLSGGHLLAAGVRPGPAVGRGLTLLRRAAFLGRWREGEPIAPLLRQAGLLAGRAKG